MDAKTAKRRSKLVTRLAEVRLHNAYAPTKRSLAKQRQLAERVRRIDIGGDR